MEKIILGYNQHLTEDKMKSLEHTIRNLLEKKSSDKFNLENELITYIQENSHTGKSRQELLEEFISLQEFKGDPSKFIKGLSDLLKKSPKSKPTQPAVPPKTEPKPSEPAPAKTEPKPSEPAPDSVPTKTTKSDTKTDAKSDTKTKTDTSGSGGKLGAIAGGVIGGSLLTKGLKRLIGSLLNPGSGGTTPGISTYGNEKQLHQANAPMRIESVSAGTEERRKVSNVSRHKLEKLRKALGKDEMGKQGSIQTKIIDESTIGFLEKAKRIKKKHETKGTHGSKVTETETVTNAKYNEENPDTQYH
jgi:hypothetical protein